MISIAICEDMTAVQTELENFIMDLLPDCPVEVFSSGTELLAFLDREETTFSIYFMDISLPGISGIETAAAIRSRDPYALIVYVTDYREYVYEVFETLPFRFITKPVEKDNFLKVLRDALNYLNSNNRMFHFHIERNQYQIPLKEILYFESSLRLVTLHTAKNSYRFYGKLRNLILDLDDLLFAQTHVSYIVNMEQIQCLDDACITLRTGEVLPVSRRFQKALRLKYMQYLKWRSS